jgi:hypothetical protein
MVYNEAQIWSAIHRQNHPMLTNEESRIAAFIPLIEELFPGINYYSITGFNQVMKNYVQPVLSKLFPDLVHKTAEQVERDKILDIKPFLSTRGYEHLDNPQWKKQLEMLLAQS